MGDRKKLGGNLRKCNKGGSKIAAAAPSPALPIPPVAISIAKYKLFGVHIVRDESYVHERIDHGPSELITTVRDESAYSHESNLLVAREIQKEMT
jgi:hypothetical protein